MKKFILFILLCTAFTLLSSCAIPIRSHGSTSSSAPNTSQATAVQSEIVSQPIAPKDIFNFSAAHPYTPPKGTISNIDAAAKKDIEDFFNSNFIGGFNSYNGASSENQESLNAMLEKYGINVFAQGLNSTKNNVIWFSAYGLIRYYGAAQDVLPALKNINATTAVAEIKKATDFSIDILDKTFKSDKISKSADGSIKAFTDNFECTNGGSERLWIIKDNKLYLCTFVHTNYGNSGISSVSVSPDGKNIAVGLFGRKGSWGYIINTENFTCSDELINSMKSTLVSSGFTPYQEVSGLYYSTIDTFSWKDNATLSIGIEISLDKPVNGSNSVKGNTIYNINTSKFDVSNLKGDASSLPSASSKQ